MLNPCSLTARDLFLVGGGPSYTVVGEMNGEVRGGKIDI